MDKNKVMIFSLISLFILMILFNKLLFGDYKFIGPDALSPAAIAQGIELSENKTGEYPLWMPWVFSGLPSVHSMQNISEYYFPHLVINFVEKFGLPRIWNYIFHFIFGGLGCFLLLKRFKVDDFSAIFGGIAFILNPYLITMVVHGHGSQMMTAVYIPWVIWSINKIKDNPKISNMGILAIIIGFQLQRAHVQIAYYTWMLVGLYILLMFLNKVTLSHQKNKAIIMIFVGLFIGLCISFNIYIPVLEYTEYSIRGGSNGGTGFEYATQWSFSLLEIGTFFIPSFCGFGGLTYWGGMPFTDYPNYMGIIVLIFAIIGGVKSKVSDKILFILAIAFALLLSLGKNFSIFYGFFYDYLPFFKKFRVPVMILIIMQFSVSILSGMGMYYLKNRFQLFKIHKILKSIVLAAVLFLVIFFLFSKEIIYTFLPKSDLLKRYGIKAQEVINNIRYDNIVNEIQFLVIILVLISVLLYLYNNKKIKWISLAYGFILLSIIDLNIVNRKIIEPSKESYRSSSLSPSIIKKRYLATDEVIDFLKNDTTKYRIFPIGQLSNQNRWSAFNLESIYGYHPAKLNNYNDFMSQVGFENINILQMLNVKYLVSLQPLEHPFFEQVFIGKLYHNNQYQEAYVYYFKKYLDRAFFVDKLKIINEDILNYIKNYNDSFIKESIINKDVKLKEFSSNREIKTTNFTPNKIDIKTKSESEQFLVISEIYYPQGWNAYINNKPTEIYQVNSILRGISVPPGSNEISFRFNPYDVRIGSIFSLLSFILSILLIIFNLYKKNEK